MGGMSHLGDTLEIAAQASPGRLALADATETLTYGEMLAESQALASSLLTATDERRPVATLIPSNARCVVAMLACLLAGRPYCVLNPAQPRRRLEALLSAVEPGLVLISDHAQRTALEAMGFPVAPPQAKEARPSAWRPPSRGEDDLAGIYITSGSSGSPKLVTYRHAAVIHRLGMYFAGLPAGRPHDLTPDDRFASTSPLWTMAAANAVFSALYAGAQLHLLDPGLGRPDALIERVQAARPTVWHSTPSVFRHLAGCGALDDNIIRVIRLTGEPLLASDVELARRVCSPSTWMIFVYGLTETNGAATQSGIALGAPGLSTSLTGSGHALDGVDVWIEDEDGTPVPAGTEGEIVIGGEFLSAGYLDPGHARTGTRFSARNGRTILHTGDRGVLDKEGALLVKGRRDRLIKIQGHRVDPSEVEAEALRLEGVLNAVVVPFRAGEKTAALALFVTSDSDDPVQPEVVRSQLRQVLQPEAVPAQVSLVKALPQTPGGKVDRPRLTAMASESSVRSLAAADQDDPVAIHLATLWAEALESERPGLDEDFFALGGDSLAAMQVCTAIQDVYGIELEPAALLDFRSPRTLAEELRRILAGAWHSQAQILRLNSEGAGAPVFCLHGAGGDATGLVHFAEAIGPAQPVDVIQLPGADGRSRPLASMDKIAAYCVSAIDESGVAPPYRIVGTSFGGLVAFHTAAVLLRAGHEVEYVGLLDTPAPRKSHPFSRRMLAEYRPFGRALFARGRGHQADQKFRNLRIACEIAAGRWKPRPLALPIHLYRCDWQPDHLVDEPALGWEELAPNLVVRSVPSRHTRHIRPPHVNQLAALVRDDLDALAAGRSREPQSDRSSGRRFTPAPSPSIARTSSSLSPSSISSGGTIAENSVPRSPS
jgi:acyl-coenzyme A synthetase/AMP-(fatty) acid ligase/thioesterase domain-containing protein/acyl carrier protein